MKTVNIAIFASGNGSNCENLIQWFEANDFIRCALVVCNNADAPVVERAKRHGIATEVINRTMLNDACYMRPLLEKYDIGFVVLAGFLLLMPGYLVEDYAHRMVNVHPALLPKYGGKGMWGMHVHEAVCRAGEAQSGITIHYVSPRFDDGEVVAQFRVDLLPDDTPADVAAKVHQLEMKWLPRVVEDVIMNQIKQQIKEKTDGRA